MKDTIIVAVGSKNKTKIDPVKELFEHHFKHVEVKGISVKSGVKEQPMSDEEAFTGAFNRAKNALKSVPGGVHKHSYGWFENSIVSL